MADQIKEVQTVDVQLLNANRERPKTYKFDNPKANLTRAMVAEAFSPALVGGWLLAADDTTAMYIGDVVLNTSKKVTLDGQDFYVTPNSITFTTASGTQNATVTVTGAQIQGYNIKRIGEGGSATLSVEIAENGLSATVTTTAPGSGAFGGSWNLILIIQGQEVTIPVTRG